MAFSLCIALFSSCYLLLHHFRCVIVLESLLSTPSLHPWTPNSHADIDNSDDPPFMVLLYEAPKSSFSVVNRLVLVG